MSKPKVAVIGDVMIDRDYTVEPHRYDNNRWRACDQQVTLGGAAHVARCCEALGAFVHLLGYLDNDAYSMVCNLCVVGSSYTKRICRKSRVWNDGKLLWRLDDDYTSAPELNTAGQPVKEFDLVLVADHDKGVFSDRSRGQLINRCQRQNVRLIVDPPNRPDWPRMWYGAPNFKCNSDEWMALPVLATREHTAGFCENLIITCGNDGSAHYTNGEGPVSHDAERVNAIDPTGCGDAFLAALGLASLKMPWDEACKVANIVAGYAATYIGTAAKLEQFASLVNGDALEPATTSEGAD